MKLGKRVRGKFTSVGGVKLDTLMKEKEPQKLACMANIKRIAQELIRKKKLTDEQIKESLGLRRYEK